MQIDSSIGNWKWSSAVYWIGYLKSVQNEKRRCFSSFLFDISKNKNWRVIFWRNWPIIASSFDNHFFLLKHHFPYFFGRIPEQTWIEVRHRNDVQSTLIDFQLNKERKIHWLLMTFIRFTRGNIHLKK